MWRMLHEQQPHMLEIYLRTAEGLFGIAAHTLGQERSGINGSFDESA